MCARHVSQIVSESVFDNRFTIAGKKCGDGHGILMALPLLCCGSDPCSLRMLWKCRGAAAAAATAVSGGSMRLLPG